MINALEFGPRVQVSRNGLANDALLMGQRAKTGNWGRGVQNMHGLPKYNHSHFWPPAARYKSQRTGSRILRLRTALLLIPICFALSACATGPYYGDSGNAGYGYGYGSAYDPYGLYGDWGGYGVGFGGWDGFGYYGGGYGGWRGGWGRGDYGHGFGGRGDFGGRGFGGGGFHGGGGFGGHGGGGHGGSGQSDGGFHGGGGFGSHGGDGHSGGGHGGGGHR
jgi:hypothetical protein